MSLLGNVLEVDLTSGRLTQTEFDPRIATNYLGGRGFNVWYLLHHLPPEAQALEPGNCLLLSCGLLTGTAVATASRLHVNALSPLTGILGSSNIGGFVGTWLRSCNIQGIIVHGRAAHPVYLLINEEEASLRPAHHLWGLDTEQTLGRIQAELGEQRVQVLTIGPAAENGALFGCIVTAKGHAAGRTGMGTVMGAKNLKAIAVTKGGHACRPADPAGVRDAVRRYVHALKASPDYRIFKDYGGAGYVQWANDKALLGANNYHSRKFPSGQALDGKSLKENVVRSSGCAHCPIQCKAELEFSREGSRHTRLHRPEFESMLNFGAKCGLGDAQAVVELDNLCTRLGLDSTSAATVIAFAMDLSEHGIVTPQDTGGRALRWGDAEAMKRLLQQMAYGEGLGKILGLGVRRAAALIGNGAEEFAAHVKGLELTAYHPASLLGTALGYAVSSRGGDYNNVYASMEHRWSAEDARRELGEPEAVDRESIKGKGALVRRAVLANIIADSLGLCKVPLFSLIGTFDLKNEAELLSAFLGRPISADDLCRTAERIATAERLFNLQRGLTAADDSLPDRFLDTGQTPLNRAALQQMVLDFYRAMGWDDGGRPLPEHVQELGISA